MTSRLFLESPCPHGRLSELGHVEGGFDHRTMDYQPPEGKDDPSHWCPGSSRTEVTVDYEAASEVYSTQAGEPGWILDATKRVVDTALGLTEGDTS